MSAWRRTALEKFPQLRHLIARSESVGMLWVDLRLKFEDAHLEPKDDAFIKGVYEFARWCMADAHNVEIATSTACHFYEHLPENRLIRRELPKYIRREEFLAMGEIFKYHLTEEEYKAFVKEYDEGWGFISRGTI